MKRVLSVFFFVALLGCDRKPEVRSTAKPLDTKAETTGFPKLDRPAQSDPATIEIVGKIVAAHTGNNPSILSKLSSISLTREGRLSIQDSPISGLNLKQSWSGVWPNRGRATWVGQAPYPQTFRMIDDKVFLDTPQPNMPPLPEKNYPDIIRDLQAQWYQLLLPLTEPGVTLAPGPDFQSSLQSLKGIRVWRDKFPQAIVYYDPKTMLIGRVSVDGIMDGLATHYEHVYFDHKPIQGFQIAERVYLRVNGREAMEFIKVEFEMAKTLPPTTFTEP